jgi:hypothetical protein
MFTAVLYLNLALLVFSIASALVSRSAARDARSTIRRTRADLESLSLELSALSVAVRRVEGRQTGLSRRNQQPVTENGLPDPTLNPEGWRAAVRRMAIKPTDKKDIQ